MDRDQENPYAAPSAASPMARAGAEVEPVAANEIHEVRYRLEPGDIEAFVKAHEAAGRAAQPRQSTSWIVWLILIGVAATLLVMTSPSRGPGAGGAVAAYGPALTRAGGVLALVAAVVVLVRWSARRARRRMAEDLGEVPEQVARISAAGLFGSAADGSISRRPWRSIPEVVVNDAILLLYVTARKGDQPMAVTIPRRAFATPDAGAAFARAARYWSHMAAELPGDAATGGGEDAGWPGPPGRIIRYELTAAERRAQSRANRAAFRGAWRGAAVVMLLTAGCGLVAAYQARLLATDAGAGGAAFPLFLGGLVGAGLFGFATARALRLIAFGPRPDARELGPVELELRPDFFLKRMPDGQEVGCVWPQVHAVGADDRFLRITQRNYSKSRPAGAVTCIPRRAFATPEDCADFLAEARARVEEAGTGPASGP